MKRGRDQDPPDLKLLRWIMDYIESNGMSPTLRDVASHLKLSLMGAEKRLRRLEEHKHIEMCRKHRSIKVIADVLGTPVRLEFVGAY